MLKVMGHVYSDKKENFKELEHALTEAGFELAYDYENNATVIKEVDDEQTDSAT